MSNLSWNNSFKWRIVELEKGLVEKDVNINEMKGLLARWLDSFDCIEDNYQICIAEDTHDFLNRGKSNG